MARLFNFSKVPLLRFFPFVLSVPSLLSPPFFSWQNLIPSSRLRYQYLQEIFPNPSFSPAYHGSMVSSEFPEFLNVPLSKDSNDHILKLTACLFTSLP